MLPCKAKVQIKSQKSCKRLQDSTLNALLRYLTYSQRGRNVSENQICYFVGSKNELSPKSNICDYKTAS